MLVTPTPVSMAGALSPVSVVTRSSVSVMRGGRADIAIKVGDALCHGQ